MKKMTALVLSVLMLFATIGALAAAGENPIAEEDEIGILTQFSVSEDELNENLQEPFFSAIPFSGFKFFDTFSSLVTALEAGTIGAIEADEYVSGYLLSRMDGLARYIPDDLPKYEVGYCMLLREDEDELCDLISGAIQEMQEDGTLDGLRDQYIVDVIAGKEPEAVEPEHFQDADIIKVALTGDRPPMDYFSAEGEAIGFNTALVAEVAKRICMNVEFISVDTGARAVALASGKADVIFWSQVGDYNDWEKADTGDQPEGTIVTNPYIKSTLCYIVRDASPLAGKKE